MARLCVDAAESSTWQSAPMPISTAAENVRLPTNEKTPNQSVAQFTGIHAKCAAWCFCLERLKKRAQINATNSVHEM